MKTSRPPKGRVRRTAVIAGIVTALGLTGCAGDPAPAEDGEDAVRFAPDMFPIALNPYEHSAEESIQGAVQQFMEPLLRFEDGELVPVLAESWETPDDFTWVFHLREGAQFHDGTPLTSADVIASFNELISLEGNLVSLFSAVSSVEAPDDLTVEFHTTEPLGTLTASLSLLFIGPAAMQDDDAFWSAPVGTGPFKVDDYVPDERIEMSRFDDYWGEATPLDSLEYVNIPEVAGRITALQTGEVDVLTNIPPDQISEVSESEGITYSAVPSYGYYFVWFNHSRDQFANAALRHALIYALDMEQIVSDLFGDMATVMQAPIPQSVFGAPALDPYPYDPERAKEMLADAGYPDGFTTTLSWPESGGPNIRPLAQAMISAWAEIGVTVEPLEKERAQYLEDSNSLQWDMQMQTNVVGTGDADYTLGRLYNCAANRLGYCNEELDELLSQARSSLDQEERAELYAQAAEIMWDDAVGIFPAELSINGAVRSNVQNFELPPSGRPFFADVSISQE